MKTQGISTPPPELKRDGEQASSERPTKRDALFDVVAVNLAQPTQQRIMAMGLSARDADAYISMAVMRRGVTVEFFKAVPSSPLTQGLVGDSSPTPPESAGSNEMNRPAPSEAD